MDKNIHSRLINLVALSTDYCATLENAPEMEQEEFIRSVLSILPRIYFEFFDIEAESVAPVMLNEWETSDFSSRHMSEQYYESIRASVAALLGENDSYLETFEKDMKYSDTPIACSISENLCDVMQPLFNFVAEVRESGGESLENSFCECKEEFSQYWSQPLCNALRALNNLLLNI
ncbi:MAG: DUF5063 domain-containing protein [Muribaculaceae bacterium]|nr:DUF5063 domain-containing protein [Muribaculaceae bacterium]